jgi:fatty-acid desaturase
LQISEPNFANDAGFARVIRKIGIHPINSVSHMTGYLNHESDDNSRNLWWAAILTYGEGWHNNDHAYPNVAKAGWKKN